MLQNLENQVEIPVALWEKTMIFFGSIIVIRQV